MTEGICPECKGLKGYWNDNHSFWDDCPTCHGTGKAQLAKASRSDRTTVAKIICRYGETCKHADCFDTGWQRLCDRAKKADQIIALLLDEEGIRKQERERVMRKIELDLIYVALEMDGTPSLHLQTNSHKSAEKWQALKEGE